MINSCMCISSLFDRKLTIDTACLPILGLAITSQKVAMHMYIYMALNSSFKSHNTNQSSNEQRFL